MNPPKAEQSYQSRTIKNTFHLVYWGVPWVGTCALMKLGPKFLWDQTVAFTLLAIGLNVAVGVGLILAHKKYILELDELQQKVYFNALAITVGAAVIAAIPWSVMESYHVIAVKANAANLMTLMTLTYVVAVLYGNWRYR